MPPGFHEKHGDIYFTDEGFPILDRFVAEYDPKVMRGEANSTDFVIKPTGDRDLDIAIADHKLGTNAKFRQERDWYGTITRIAVACSSLKRKCTMRLGTPAA